ncbi:MAG: diguanylate cyclase [Merismopediaceae bacterium]|nr:diguanylate cyclase [Merismopediaceae bacterium]
MIPFNPQSYLILVVDDITKNLQLVMEILEQVGYATTFAIGGRQALDRLQTLQPDLILLDLMMPEINGIEVCKILKADEKYQDIPIIFLTASNDREHLVEAFAVGATDYITKPFHAPELLARVKTHLSLKKAQDELKEAYATLEKIVTIDELTNVSNRRAIFAFGEQEFQRAKRYGSDFSVMMIDLDYFKDVNDTYGHYSGDECLRLVANTLKSSIRNTDQVGRFGGEEFITILPETKLGEAIDLGERLRHLIVCLCPKFENQVINLSVSIGVTNYHKNDETLDDVLRRADKALYSAKDQGRNRIVSL